MEPSSLLSEAYSQGHLIDFVFDPFGRLFSPLAPDRFYSEDEYSQQPIVYPEYKASLYLVTTDDGLRGNHIHHWDH